MAGCWRHPEMGRRIAWTAAGFALFFLAALVALLCVAIPTESASELQDAGARATAFSALATLPPATWRELRQSGLLTFGIFAGGFLAAWWNGRKGDSTRVLPLVALTTAAACLMAIHSVAAVAPFFSSAQAARALSPLLHQEDRVIFDGDPPLASSLCFYLPQPFYYTGTEANYEFAVQTTGLGKDRFLSEDEVLTHWKKGGGVYLIIERERVTFWQSLLGEWRVIQKFGSQKIISPPLPDDPQS